MLFGSIVLMYKSLQIDSITVLIVSLNIIIVTNAETQRDNAMKFSGDFESFLRDLGSLVYKKKYTSDHPTTYSYIHRTTTPAVAEYKINRRSESMLNTQKAALRDVLMMKLVSYYEDKYKLAHNDPTTTERISYMKTFTQPLRTIKVPHNNKYNEVDGADRRYSNIPKSIPFEGRNRRRNYDENAPVIPEVVIL